MAFDPIQEDCLRLVLAAMRREHIYPLENEPFIESCMEAFQSDPARLIVDDTDRAFHLVVQATELLDYRLPFIADDTEADQLAATAEHQLREACSLDPRNWDAQRMLAGITANTNDAYVSYLLDHRDEVLEEAVSLKERARDPWEREFAADLGVRPYLRWEAAIASRALIAGQYRLALSAAERSLEAAPTDPAGVRQTAVLAMAKLECDAEQIGAFSRKHALSSTLTLQQGRRQPQQAPAPDAWTLIAQLSCAYRALDYDGATRILRAILKTYPRAAEPLYFQAEFPEGVFGRVNVEAGSEDELILALSEATPLLQEGVGAPESASLAAWIGTHDAVQSALSRLDARMTTPQGRPLRGDN